MAFIDRIVGPDEELIGILSVHWIYGIKGLAWMTGFLLLGLFIDYQVESFIFGEGRYGGLIALDILANYAFMVCAFLGGLLLLFYILMMLTTELGLTNKRVIFKRGWIAVDVKESDLEEIKAAEVDNGYFGRFLNYGYINFDARFVENITLPAITDPYRFVKAMNEARTELREDSMTVVLGGPGAANNKVIEPADRAAQTYEHEKPLHDLHEARYDSIDSDPAAAVKNMMADTEDETRRSINKIEKDADNIAEATSQKPKKKKADSRTETSESPAQNTDNTAQKPSNKTGLATSKPILFKRDVLKHKARLQQKMMSAFKRKSEKSEKS